MLKNIKPIDLCNCFKFTLPVISIYPGGSVVNSYLYF